MEILKGKDRIGNRKKEKLVWRGVINTGSFEQEETEPMRGGRKENTNKGRQDPFSPACPENILQI